MEKEENSVEILPVDGSLRMDSKEAKKLLKKHHYKVSNGDVDAFVRLKDINKIYPNGVQAVYDFNMDINEHDFIVLVGPSGCGKSTTLRMVAGLEDITSGYLYINKVLSNYLPSKDRDISMVFQSYALYPQMTVFDNIAFPLRSRKYRKAKKVHIAEAFDQLQPILEDEETIRSALKEAQDRNLNFGNGAEFMETKFKINSVAGKYLYKYARAGLTNKKEFLEEIKTKKDAELSKLKEKGISMNEKYEQVMNGEILYHDVKLTKSEIREKVFDAAKILDLGQYLDRRPKELSGGQMQRVALGRAIVRDARLFLMDEPLSNLDAKLRVAMRSEIVRIHEQIGATTIYVTHDQTEAMTMATKIAVMSKGWVQQIGAPQEIYNRPKNIFVATFIGAPAMNIFNGTYDRGVISFPNGFKFKMKEEFDKLHNEFYSKKLSDINSMLEKKEFVQLHALSALDHCVATFHASCPLRKHEDGTLFTDEEMKPIIEEFNKKNLADRESYYKEFIAVTRNLETDEETKAILTQLPQDNIEESHLSSFTSVRKALLKNLTGISSKDLGLLHNAQVFNKDDKKVDDTMFYKKKRYTQKKKKTHVRMSSADIHFSNDLYEIAIRLKTSFEAALKGAHDIRIGIRPEFIHLSNEFIGNNKSEAFKIKSEVVELMGSELLLHTNWNEVDMIAKISTGTLVKPHTDVELAFDIDKVLLFDAQSGDTLLKE